MTEVIKGNLVDPSSLDVSKLNSEALVANIQSSGVPLGSGSLVSGSSVYWGKSGNSLLVDTPTTMQIVYSMGVKWLKPLASFREDFSHTNPMVQYDMERYIDYRRAKGRIRDFISTLPTRHRNILTDYFNGLSCAEISRNLNVSRQAVHAIITKYKNKLKKEVVNVKPFKSKNNETCSCNRREYTAG